MLANDTERVQNAACRSFRGLLSLADNKRPVTLSGEHVHPQNGGHFGSNTDRDNASISWKIFLEKFKAQTFPVERLSQVSR